MIDIDKEDLIKANRAVNETFGTSAYWVKEELIDSALSSYYYYEEELEQICSVFRGLAKNHAFSNGNKRTAGLFLSQYLLDLGYKISDESLVDIVLDVAKSNYEVEEIAEKVAKLCIQQ